MLVLVVVANLLVLNMVLMHSNKLYAFYKWAYTKIKSPKFESGELVMIGGLEFKIIHTAKDLKPYTYYCVPVISSKYYGSNYFHESELKKKTGLLKELE